MPATLVTPPADDPITLAEAKEHLRVDHTDQDALITSLIKAATEYVQDATNRVFITQTWKLTLDAFPVDDIALTPGPVQSVTSVSYAPAAGGELVAVDAGLYAADLSTGWLYTLEPMGWPSTASTRQAVSVRFVAGYGDADAVPAPIKQAIKLLVAHWYANAELVTEKKGERLPFGVDALIAPYRVFV